MKYQVRAQDHQFEVEVGGEAPQYLLRIDGRQATVDACTLGDRSLLSVLLDHVSYLAHVVPVHAAPGAFDVSIGGKQVRIRVLDELAAMAQQMQAPAVQGRVVLRSPMPGLVIDVRVRPGDRVRAGSPLVVVEAMKMQNELASEVAGTVSEVQAQLNQAVESGATLVVIEADGNAG